MASPWRNYRSVLGTPQDLGVVAQKDLKAYTAYANWCSSLGLAFADYAVWHQETKRISETPQSEGGHRVLQANR